MANSYVLDSKRRVEDTLFTTVTFTLNGVTIAPVEIAHFQPQSKAEVKANILNRGITEKRKLDAITAIDSFINALDTSG